MRWLILLMVSGIFAFGADLKAAVPAQTVPRLQTKDVSALESFPASTPLLEVEWEADLDDVSPADCAAAQDLLPVPFDETSKSAADDDPAPRREKEWDCEYHDPCYDGDPEAELIATGVAYTVVGAIYLGAALAHDDSCSMRADSRAFPLVLIIIFSLCAIGRFKRRAFAFRSRQSQ